MQGETGLGRVWQVEARQVWSWQVRVLRWQWGRAGLYERGRVRFPPPPIPLQLSSRSTYLGVSSMREIGSHSGGILWSVRAHTGYPEGVHAGCAKG